MVAHDFLDWVLHQCLFIIVNYLWSQQRGGIYLDSGEDEDEEEEEKLDDEEKRLPLAHVTKQPRWRNAVKKMMVLVR